MLKLVVHIMTRERKMVNDSGQLTHYSDWPR